MKTEVEQIDPKSLDNVETPIQISTDRSGDSQKDKPKLIQITELDLAAELPDKISEGDPDSNATYFERALHKTQSAYNEVGDALQRAKESAGEAYHGVGDALQRAKDSAGEALHNAKEATGETLHNMQVGMKEFKDASLEKLQEAGKKLKRFIGSKADAEQHGHEIDNEYIHNGYRINHNSCCGAFLSIGTCHNETINVWSHLGGAFFFLLLLCSLFGFVIPQQFAFNKRINHDFQTSVATSGCPQTMFADSSTLSCFLAGQVTDYSTEVQTFMTSDLDHTQTKKEFKGLVDKARGLVYFAMDNQRDFSYLVGQPSTVLKADQLEYSSIALLQLWESNIQAFSSEMILTLSELHKFVDQYN